MKYKARWYFYIRKICEFICLKYFSYLLSKIFYHLYLKSKVCFKIN